MKMAPSKIVPTSAELLVWCAATPVRHEVSHALHMIKAMPVTAGANDTKL